MAAPHDDAVTAERARLPVRIRFAPPASPLKRHAAPQAPAAPAAPRAAEEPAAAAAAAAAAGGVHSLPCHIEYSGPAPVSAFFRPEPADSQDPSLRHAYFRGRQLTGNAVALPHGGRGLVVERSGRVSGKGMDAEIEWRVASEFDAFFLWNRDTAVGERDGVRRALEVWPLVARALHEPIPLPTDAGASAALSSEGK